MKTPIFNIHDLILVLTLAVCVLLVIFQWLLSKQKAIASQLLSGFFVCVGASALCNLLLWNDYIGLHSELAKITLALGLATAVAGKSVCLYLYVVAITRANFSLRAKDALHLLNLVAVLGLVFGGGLDSDRLRFLRIYMNWSMRGKCAWKTWWRQLSEAAQAKKARNARSGRPLS